MAPIIMEGIPQCHRIESLVNHSRITGSPVKWRRGLRGAPLSPGAWTPTAGLNVGHYPSTIRSLIPAYESHLTEPTWPTLRGVFTSIRCKSDGFCLTSASRQNASDDERCDNEKYQHHPDEQPCGLSGI